MGEILNEVGRALSDSESEWVATNAESFLGLDTPGENYYVLASSLLNPFSSSGAYSLTVYYTSETRSLTDSDGFESEVPVLYIIDNENQLYEDYNTYQNADAWRSSLINEIIRLNGGTVSEPEPEPVYVDSSSDYYSTPEDTTYGDGGNYLIPGGESRYITEADIQGMDSVTLELAKNEFYARHGRKFVTESIQAYFNQQPWYNGTIEPDDFTDDVFNEYEIANIAFIVQHEQMLKEGQS